jgi:hypothetical protein
MSIADAVRARELEARVDALEARVAELEKGGGNGGAHLAQRINLLQGQLNALRYKGEPVKTDDAAR